MSSLKQQVADFIEKNPNAITFSIAKELEQPEGTVILNLPDQFVRLIPAERAQELMESLPTWGEFMTLIIKEGCIFEIEGAFPEGSFGRNYYNLKHGQGTIGGHLKLESIAHIAFVSFPFHGMESYNIAFIAHSGDVIFNLYLTRDEERNLLPEQVEKFKSFN